MDYKKLIPNKDLRLKILKMTEFIPDKVMVRIQYFIKTGMLLKLKNPKRFNEKIQAYKLYWRDDLMTVCADKVKAREYINNKNLSDIIIPLYGVYNDANEIEFNELPDKFVIKTNNGSGTNIICEDKNQMNINQMKNQVNLWLNKRTVKAGREWAYYNIEPKILIEKFIEYNGDLIDYKFYCFNGEPKYIKLAILDNKTKIVRNSFYDMDFNKLPYYRKGIKEIECKINKPKNFDKMIEICKILSKDFPHVRIDLYNLEGEIYFGEFTFYDNSGYEKFIPDHLDYVLGNYFTLDIKEGN